MPLGLTDARWSRTRLPAGSLFPSRNRVPSEWSRLCRREREVAPVPPGTP